MVKMLLLKLLLIEVDKKTGDKATENDISNKAGIYLVTYDVKYADVSVGKVEVTVIVKTEEG